MRTRLFGLLMAVVILLMPFSVMAQDDMMHMGMDMMEACPIPEGLPETITLGAVLTLSGGASVYGATQQNGIQMALDEINESAYLF